MSKRFIYICSPLRGNYEENMKNAETYCRLVMKYVPNAVPLAPHIYFPRFLDDTDAEERELGISAGLSLLDKCDELWAFGIYNPSEGMKREIDYAKKRGIPVRDGNDALQCAICMFMQGGTFI